MKKHSLLLGLVVPALAFSTEPAPIMGCGASPGVGTHTCETCPYAFVENVPVANIKMNDNIPPGEYGDDVHTTLCTGCDHSVYDKEDPMYGQMLTAANAVTWDVNHMGIDATITCFAGVRLTCPGGAC